MFLPELVAQLHWITPGKAEFLRLFQERYQYLRQFHVGCSPNATAPTVLLNEKEPLCFLAGFFAAVAAEAPVFLGNPQWQVSEWQQVFQQVHPQVIWGSVPICPEYGAVGCVRPGTIMIATGGSSGKIRFAMHTWQTLTAAVEGFVTYFADAPIHSCCVLPVYHVSGLMSVLRSLLTGGNLALFPYQSLGGRLPWHLGDYFVSLVPTQLKRLLSAPEHCLGEFRAVLLGGGPVWPALLQEAKEAKIPLGLTYGMTETAALIAAVKPERFLRGNVWGGEVLPHAQVRICDDGGKSLPRRELGRVAIAASSLALGYFPDLFNSAHSFLTEDMGYLDDQGFLHILGRSSQVIVTGGEKVFPQEVEGVILATQLVEDVVVMGMADGDWGEVVTAIYVPQGEGVREEDLQGAIAGCLSCYKQPKRWVRVKELPRSPQGKLNRERLRYWLCGDGEHL